MRVESVSFILMSDPDAVMEAKLKLIDHTHHYVDVKTALLIIDMQHSFVD